jgi:two-component system response regulator
MEQHQQQHASCILIAENDPDDRRLLQEAFNESRVSEPPIFFDDGNGLLECLETRHNALPAPPGLILLDLHMPRKNGHETLQAIRADEQLSLIPVVMLTNSRTDADIHRSYRLGADGFITKPLFFHDLIHVIEKAADFWLRAAEPAAKGPPPS